MHLFSAMFLLVMLAVLPCKVRTPAPTHKFRKQCRSPVYAPFNTYNCYFQTRKLNSRCRDLYNVVAKFLLILWHCKQNERTRRFLLIIWGNSGCWQIPASVADWAVQVFKGTTQNVKTLRDLWSKNAAPITQPFRADQSPKLVVKWRRVTCESVVQWLMAITQEIRAPLGKKRWRAVMWRL